MNIFEAPKEPRQWDVYEITPEHTTFKCRNCGGQVEMVDGDSASTLDGHECEVDWDDL